MSVRASSAPFLALLVYNVNRVVPRSVVVDALWEDALPLDPKAALQVVVSRLRAALGSYGSRVVAEPGGYRLDAGPEEVDFLQAESLLGDGRLALANSEGARAADAFDRALSLWTGDALRDLEDFPFSVRAAQHSARPSCDVGRSAQ